ncbi:Hypothetical predicted protein [Mytilus galloprovincialis]|uniref:Uncharacterized protein n=1 Tax=Mytilus galloprovincialis TaxID=29158 RepID=A0A8B6DT72_MYTGA|nr:Hypothetical predicted protein [Mytilus galloprovincialis]
MTTMKVLLTVFLLSTLIGIGCARTCGSVGGYCSNGRCGRGYYVVRGVSGCWNRQTCCAKSKYTTVGIGMTDMRDLIGMIYMREMIGIKIMN